MLSSDIFCVFIYCNLVQTMFSVPGPDFVGAVEDKDFVYFFFREEAVEFMNCGKVSLKNSKNTHACAFFSFVT